MSQPRSTLDGLPKEFVRSLRVLFDILDDNGSGYVKLTDIAAYWESETVTGLPPGIIEALKKVTPASGQLSFERFVAGLKIALLRLKSEKIPQPEPNHVKPHQLRSVSQPDLIPSKQSVQAQGPPLAPSQAFSRAPQLSQMNSRTKSMPRLGWDADRVGEAVEPMNVVRPEPQYAWHQPRTWNDNQQQEKQQAWKGNTAPADGQYYNDRRPGDGRSSISTAAALNKYNTDVDSPSRAKRREPRRHTLANGVDYNMIKRMKQLEAERDILLQGYEAVEAAREWYQNNLSNVEQRMKYVAQPTAHGDQSSVEANQERISFQTTRILEVNQQLRALIDSSKKGFPFHMHLAMAQSTMERNETEKDNTIAMLKAQNKMLTKEVSNKSDSISKLEREKAQLLKNMFQGRQQQHHHHQQQTTYDEYDDTTFI